MKNKRTGTRRDLDGNIIPANDRYLHCDNPWEHWWGMPHYDPRGSEAYHTLKIEFDSEEDYQEFQREIEQEMTDKTKSIWHPKLKIDNYGAIRWAAENTPDNQPKYPIYIPSKGRWEKRLTSDTLVELGIKHYMIVEAHQLEEYKKHVDENFVTLLVLPQEYLDNYDTFDDLGSTRSKGPGAARNFAWDHSISLGAKRHWVMDDNAKNLYRLDGNKRTIVSTGAVLRAMEDHTDRYDNVYISGPHYRFFAVPSERLPPFVPNCRIYSCLLIRNDIVDKNGKPYRWRGRYNEDTDLSLRVLKDGYCTIQYNAFLTGKLVTQAMAGGNTEEFYSKEGTLPKSQMIVDMHPDVARLKWMNGRWHHWVDYSPYEGNRLKYRDDIEIKSGCNEYGMELKYIQGQVDEDED